MEEFRDKLIECMYNNNIPQSCNTDSTQQQSEQQHSIDSLISTRLRNIHMTGPNGIRVKLTNEVLQNMKNESIYRCLLTKGKFFISVVNHYLFHNHHHHHHH